ncbi:MAG: HEAT repeat domain-containing protein, partial [Planctomycetota bacterium]
MRSHIIFMTIFMMAFSGLLEAGHHPPPVRPKPKLPLNDKGMFQTGSVDLSAVERPVEPPYSEALYDDHYSNNGLRGAHPYSNLDVDFSFPGTGLVSGDSSALTWSTLIRRLASPSFPVGLEDLDERGRKDKARQESAAFDDRHSALSSLAQAKTSQAEPYIIGMLCDAEPKLRRAAVELLRKRAIPEVPLLMVAAHDPNDELMAFLQEACRLKPDEIMAIREVATMKPRDLAKRLLEPASSAVLLVRLESMVCRLRQVDSDLVNVQPRVDVPTSDPLWPAIQIYHAHVRSFTGLEASFDPSHMSHWWNRYLAARAMGDAENPITVTPALLERQRDWFPVVRLEANRSLIKLHHLRYRMSIPRNVIAEGMIVTLWERWWKQACELKLPADGWLGIPLKSSEGLVYGVGGPVRHPMLVGKVGATSISLIDHNDNGQFSDYGEDNITLGDPLKPGLFASRILQLNGMWYRSRFRRDGQALELRKLEAPMGELVITGSYGQRAGLDVVALEGSADIYLTLFCDEQGHFEG